MILFLSNCIIYNFFISFLIKNRQNCIIKENLCFNKIILKPNRFSEIIQFIINLKKMEEKE